MARGTVTIEITGLDKLQRKLRELPLRVQNAVLRKGLRAAANVVRDEARRRAPVRTGNLRRNIATSVSVRRGQGSATVGPKPKAYYGMFVELGTSKMAARPFLRPALDSKKDEVRQIFVARVEEEIEKARERG